MSLNPSATSFTPTGAAPAQASASRIPSPQAPASRMPAGGGPLLQQGFHPNVGLHPLQLRREEYRSTGGYWPTLTGLTGLPMGPTMAPLSHGQVPMAPLPPAMVYPPPVVIPQAFLDNLPPETRVVVDLLQQQTQQQMQAMGAQITQMRGDLCFMTDTVLETEEAITDREATADIRDGVLDLFEKRYPRVATPGGTMPKKRKLTELRPSDLSSRLDRGSPHGPHYSKYLTEGVDTQNKTLHKAVKENMATSYANKAQEFLDNLGDLKENAPSDQQKRGYAKIAKKFEDVPAKSQNYVARKQHRARNSAIPPRIRQVRENAQSRHDG